MFQNTEHDLIQFGSGYGDFIHDAEQERVRFLERHIAVIGAAQRVSVFMGVHPPQDKDVEASIVDCIQMVVKYPQMKANCQNQSAMEVMDKAYNAASNYLLNTRLANN